jgi:hypothetical protein
MSYASILTHSKLAVLLPQLMTYLLIHIVEAHKSTICTIPEYSHVANVLTINLYSAIRRCFTRETDQINKALSEVCD